MEVRENPVMKTKALVPIKRVIDYNVSPRVKADGSGVDLANVKMSRAAQTSIAENYIGLPV
tara:strand:- start:9181 stop:9363 length:183 start_codon:yes stop_codon:yes gene_type:complete